MDTGDVEGWRENSGRFDGRCRASCEMAGDGQLVRLVSQITFNGLPPTIHYFLFCPWSWMPISMGICRDSLDGCGAIGHSRYK